MYYEVKISCIINEDGQERKRTDAFIVKAYSVIEAVTAFEKYMEDTSGLNIYTEWETVSVKTTPYTEIVNFDDYPANGTGKFYRVKINQMTVNEATGKEKKTPQYILILASDIDEAKQKYEGFIRDWVIDVELEAVSETKIIDFVANSKNNP